MFTILALLSGPGTPFSQCSGQPGFDGSHQRFSSAAHVQSAETNTFSTDGAHVGLSSNVLGYLLNAPIGLSPLSAAEWFNVDETSVAAYILLSIEERRFVRLNA
ncbi:hypothetical protein EVAR_14679_1 [Eumeta japonica]|uniref:Uncharacterized protein n=1 Tax=Eumeta variegata TaxID=151549 RepID=A0A4C1U2E4_EUMVA|nr:hypothetical protein EVAR_14679_1 [Eumeta japonica]